MPQTVAVQTASHLDTLAEKIASRTARVGIVGLGYVGLPLAVEFAKAGFSVTGIDAVESKVARINAGDSYIQDVNGNDVLTLGRSGKTSRYNRFLGRCGARYAEHLRSHSAP